MIRMSALRNFPVICNGRQIGLLQSISLDTAQKRVSALVISCGIRGKRIVRQKDIESIADSFILIKNAEKYRRSFEAKPCCFVRDTAGLLTGKVTDYALELETGQVIAVEMQLSYCMPQHKKRIWIYDYMRTSENRSELTVPSSLGSELIVSEEGDRTCVCQP